jgi:DNA-binding PucR family transcriptional regulator
LTEVARELHLHPQAVRYRTARPRERLDDAIDAPEARCQLEMALRADLSPAGEPAPAR